MKTVFRVALFAASMTVFALVCAPSTQAVDIINPVCRNPNASQRPAFCNDNLTSSSEAGNPLFGRSGILTKATQILSYVVGIVAIAVATLSGLRMSLSSGDSQAFGKARKALILAMVGIMVAVLAQGIVMFVLTKI